MQVLLCVDVCLLHNQSSLHRTLPPLRRRLRHELAPETVVGETVTQLRFATERTQHLATWHVVLDFSHRIYLEPKVYIWREVQSKMNIHLWSMNYSNSMAWMSSTTLRAASCKLTFLPAFFLPKIWMSRVMRLGQTDLNNLLRLIAESLISRIRMQKRMRMRRAGGASSCFITSLRDSSTTRSLFS